MSKAVIMPKEDFRQMQLLQLDLLKELDRVCRKHNIRYVITCGTLLGAIRHKGYIPWDDDADIAMLRKDYEKFRRVTGELNPGICTFQDHSVDPDYLWGYGKLRRTGTSCVRAGQEHMKGKTGVFIDIFPMDFVPNTVPGQLIQNFYCFFLRKILWARVGKLQEHGGVKAVYSLLSKISVDWVYRRIGNMIKKSKGYHSGRVRILLFTSFGKLNYKHELKERYSMPVSWFTERAEYDFEGQKLYGSKDYDGFLKYMYRNYMTLPPEGKRDPHAPFSSYEFLVKPGEVYTEKVNADKL